MRATLAALLLALVLLVPAAEAQAPVSRLQLSLPSGKMHMKIPSEHPMTLSVVLKLENLVCASGAEATVSLKEDSSPMDGVMLHFKATSLKFTIPQGAYQNVSGTGANPWTSSPQSAEFSVMVDEKAPEDHGHAFTIKAELPAGTPTNCHASASVPAASATGSHEIHIMPRPAPAGGSSTPLEGQAGGALEAEAGSPGPEALVFLLALAGVAWARRRN